MLQYLLNNPNPEVFIQLKRLNVTHVVLPIEGEENKYAVGIDTDGLHVELYRAVAQTLQDYEWRLDVPEISRSDKAV